jgi:hypothetical protein
VTDSRLHSTKPIDDEVPFEDAENVHRDEEPEAEDALVTPAAAERQRIMPDRDVEPSARQADDLVEDKGDAS